ncbi:hypothetical protein TNCV_4169831 [Trichonephila clavipes]|nr:hypothetical protein TNCV_4169831 [Trichonephila clavipes]
MVLVAQCVVRACPKHARLDWCVYVAIPYAVLFQFKCSPPDECMRSGIIMCEMGKWAKIDKKFHKRPVKSTNDMQVGN